MAEGGQETNIYISAGTVNFNALRDAGNINIAESNIQKIEISGDNESGASTEDKPRSVSTKSDSGTQDNPTPDANLKSTARKRGVKHKQSAQPSQQSDDAPSGPGWVKLSTSVYMNSKQPIKKAIHTVYKGKQRMGGAWRDVAIKLIPHSDENYKEIQLHLKLEHHQNIIRMHDAGEIPNNAPPQIFIVMELCSQTLGDFIRKSEKNSFDFEQRFSFAKQIVEGVAFIHKNRILHRDIKLENILISAINDSIRVADFGLSKQLQSDRSIATASVRGLGTDGYRAPEMLHEKPQASFYSDSFSLGIVLSMLFSNGQHPFGPDPVRWRTNILDHKGLDLSTILQFDEPHTHKRNQLLDLIGRVLIPSSQDRLKPKLMLDHPFFSQTTGGPSPPAPTLRAVVSDGISDEPMTKDKRPTKPAAQGKNSPGKQRQLVNAAGNHQIADDARLKFLEDELKKPLNEIGYEKSTQLLEELLNLRGSDDLDILLQLAECHLQLMSDKKDSSIANVSKFLAKRSSEDVREIAEILYEKKEHVQAMILLKISDDLRKNEDNLSPDEEVGWIRERVVDIYWAIEPLAKESGRSRDLVEQYGLKYMHDMLVDLLGVKNASAEVRALNELDCLVDIASICDDIGNYERSIALGEAALTMMQREFGKRVRNYKRYGQLLNNLGRVYANSGQYAKAEHRYIAALEVLEKALDYEDEKNREEEIVLTNRNLEVTHKNLGEYYQQTSSTKS